MSEIASFKDRCDGSNRLTVFEFVNLPHRIRLPRDQ